MKMLLFMLIGLTLGFSVVTTISIPAVYAGGEEDGNKQKAEDESVAAIADCDWNDIDGADFDCIASVASAQQDKARDLICPDDTQLNPTTGKCEGDPICPPGTDYNEATDRCETAPTDCPTPGQYNPATNRCEAQPNAAGACPFGYPTLNPSTNSCINPAHSPNEPCPTGTTLDPGADTCFVPASCPTGTGPNPNPITNKCEGAPQVSQ
jgi:hypothetical protein